MDNGLMHLYYGEGKGKTTAAVGLAIRAAGAGRQVLFAQFMKGGKTGELSVFKSLSNITVLRSEKDFPFYRKMTEEEKAEQTLIHNRMLDNILDRFQKRECDVIVLDEITYPYAWKLIDCRKVRELLLAVRGRAEVICTGRNPDAFFLGQADYATEMKCIRHPYGKGIAAREGIEY